MVQTRQRTLDPDDLGPLSAYLAHVLGVPVVIDSVALLGGGAVQENWRLTIEVQGGARNGRHDWVLRTDAAARLPVSLDRNGEFRVLQAAYRGGVKVAEPILECPDASIIGAPFTVQAFVGGAAQARSLVRDPALAVHGDDLAFQLGAQLARIHQITPEAGGDDLTFLTLPTQSPALIEIGRFRAALDDAAEARPALEYILCWLEAFAPTAKRIALVHGDYRTGNYLVEAGAINAVLDWEFAHWGDPAEDLGWLTARCWRFGNDDRPAGGIGSRAALHAGYESIAPLPADASALAYWEIMAAAKWATIAVLQGDRYRKGGEDSLELVLTGLMAPEMELDALLQIETLSKALPKGATV